MTDDISPEISSGNHLKFSDNKNAARKVSSEESDEEEKNEDDEEDEDDDDYDVYDEDADQKK